MQTYKQGTDIPVSFALVNEAGEAITPVSARWRVLDELDAVLQDWADVSPLPTEPSLAVTVPAALNNLAAGVVRGLRQVELEVETAQGTFGFSELALIQAGTILVFGQNTFQAYAKAALEGSAIANLNGWESSPRRAQELALIEAYARIMLLNIIVDYSDSQSVIRDVEGTVPRLRDLTPAQMEKLDPKMLAALRRAQILEADEILAGDEVSRARHNGLLSMTVGESSQFFRSAKPLDTPINPRAMREISRWVSNRLVIGRR